MTVQQPFHLEPSEPVTNHYYPHLISLEEHNSCRRYGIHPKTRFSVVLDIAALYDTDFKRLYRLIGDVQRKLTIIPIAGFR